MDEKPEPYPEKSSGKESSEMMEGKVRIVCYARGPIKAGKTHALLAIREKLEELGFTVWGPEDVYYENARVERLMAEREVWWRLEAEAEPQS
ncbi:hypothetical protein DRN43_00695 [Thermococci archaeon]|nr:MAG: hypothetical protein DRN43_00695 [Thermococci archaeon]